MGRCLRSIGGMSSNPDEVLLGSVLRILRVFCVIIKCEGFSVFCGDVAGFDRVNVVIVVFFTLFSSNSLVRMSVHLLFQPCA